MSTKAIIEQELALWNDQIYRNKLVLITKDIKEANIFIELHRTNRKTGNSFVKAWNLSLIKYFNQIADEKKGSKNSLKK